MRKLLPNEITMHLGWRVCALCKGTGKIIKRPTQPFLRRAIISLEKAGFVARDIKDILGFENHSLVNYYRDGGWKKKGLQPKNNQE